MAYKRDISNSADILDSRDIIERIDELESARQSAIDGAKELKAEIDALEALDEHTIEQADELQNKRLALWTSDVLSKGEHYQECSDWTEDDVQELRVLLALQNEAEGSPDWRHGETLIRDTYFEQYAQDLAEDCGMVNRDASWPNDHIDWESAADALKQDYFSVDYDGVDYWIRS